MSRSHRQGPELPEDDATTDVLDLSGGGRRPGGRRRRRVPRWVTIPAAVLGGLFVVLVIAAIVSGPPAPSSTSAAPGTAPSSSSAPPPSSSSTPSTSNRGGDNLGDLAKLPPTCQAFEQLRTTINTETPKGPDVIPAAQRLRDVGQGGTRTLRRDADAVDADVLSERWYDDGNVTDPPFAAMLDACYPDAPP